jgi:VWA domain containing CoxE-like protein
MQAVRLEQRLDSLRIALSGKIAYQQKQPTMRVMLSVLLVATGISFATPLAAQSDPCLRRIVAASVVGTHGAIFSDLTAANFEASVHHQPLRIVSVTRDESPRRILVALDASGSMHDGWKGNIALVRGLLASLRPDDEMGLVVFSDHILDSVQLMRERGPLSVELARLSESSAARPKGLTALWDSLAGAAEQFNTPQFGDSILVFSDGDDNRSHVTESKLESILMEKGIRVFGLALPPGNWGMEIREPRSKGQSRQPEIYTGGYSVYFMSPARMDASLPVAADASGRQTVVATAQFELHMILTVEKVEIELPERIQKPEDWTLSVHGLSDPRLRVAYPHTLGVCRAE